MDENQTIDWDAISDTAPPPPADGTYKAKILSAECTEAKSGNKMIAIKLRLQTSITGEEAKGTIYTNAVFADGAMFRVKQLVKAAEVAGPTNSSKEALEQFAADLMGVELWIRSKQAPNQKGEMRADVHAYLTAEQAHDGTTPATPAAGNGRKRRG